MPTKKKAAPIGAALEAKATPGGVDARCLPLSKEYFGLAALVSLGRVTEVRDGSGELQLVHLKMDLESIDTFIANLGDENQRRALRAEVLTAFAAFKRRDFDVALTLMAIVDARCTALALHKELLPKAMRDENTQAGRRAGGAASAKARAKLPRRAELLVELQSKIDNGAEPSAAKAALQKKYGVSRSGLNTALREKKLQPT